jgi:hypothetical protein
MFIASEYQLQHEAPFGAKWISLPEELNNDFSYGPINILLLWSTKTGSTTILFSRKESF